MHDPSAVTTYLFTDIEGSTGHWEREPQRMVAALAQHDAIAHTQVTSHGGTVVKTTGDGIHAVFADPLGAVRAAVALQLALADADATGGIALRVRCGLHAGVDARRDNDYYGNAVNRAARVMSAAHGGQILVSQAVATLVAGRLPDDISLLDLGQVRLRGLAQPEQVCQVVHPALPREFPALRSLAETPNNLPQQLTSFVARERELAEVAKLLGETRLLTLLGGGGFGKTRLSLQVAADVLDDYPDGVWFVELAPVGDPRLVPQAVASALGVKEDPGYPVLDALRKFARERRFLLVLDNCEHVVQACAEIARLLLEAGAGVTILASSREALNVRGECVYPLAPLTVPSPETGLRAEAIAGVPAVQLFVDRAAAASPSFHVTYDNAEAVAAICRRLDGIPLALELAAARLRSMPVERIAERLSDRFRLLTSGDRTALPRQQTLRALIDWSHDLLDEHERVLFRRLSVFAGGFTLDAVEKVGAGGDIAEADVVDLVSRLVEKSLVMRDAAGERYRMLETVREYAVERLRASDEMPATRDRHLHYYLALAEKAAPHLISASQGPWLLRLDPELENLLGAHGWCDHAADGGPLGLRLVRAVRFYFFSRGLVTLGYRMTLEALGRDGAQRREFARCRALSDAGQFAKKMGRNHEALNYLQESLAVAREIGDRARVAVALQPLGMTYLALGETATARTCLMEALDLAHAQGDKREIAAAMSTLGQLHRIEGDLAAAEAASRHVLALARELDDRQSIGFELLNLAMIAILRDDAADARSLLREIAAIDAEIGDKTLAQGMLDVAAGLAVLRGDAAGAARFHGAAEAQLGRAGARRDPADEAFVATVVGRARAELGKQAFDSAAEAGRAIPLAAALASLGE